MELEDVSENAAGGADLAGAAGVRALSAPTGVPVGSSDLSGVAGVVGSAEMQTEISSLASASISSLVSYFRRVSGSFTSADLSSLPGDEVLGLLENAELLARLTDSLKAFIAADIIKRDELPLSYGHKNHHLLIRDVTRSSYKQVSLLTRMAETFNRVAEWAGGADVPADAGELAYDADELGGDNTQPGATDEQGSSSVVPGGLLVDRFAAGELDLETAVLIADSVDKTVKLDTELEAAGITPAEADLAVDLGADLGTEGLETDGTDNDPNGVVDDQTTGPAFGAGLARGIEQRLLSVDTHVDQMRTLARNSFKNLEIKYAVNPDELKRKQVAKRSLTLGTEKDGLVPIFGNLVPDTAALLVTAFDAINSPRTKSAVGFVTEEEADEALKHKDDQFVTRSNAQARHDAFTTLISFGLQNDETPMLGGEAATLIVTTTLEDLKNPQGTATVASPHGGVTVVDAAAARHTACVGSVLKVTLDQGKIVALHSLDRVFTRKMRKAILARDGGCIIPRCTVPANWCEVHHVTEHAKGGPTSVDNGVTLCWFHHRYLDSHGWVVGIRNGVATARRAENQRDQNLRTENTQAQNRRPANERSDKKSAENKRTENGRTGNSQAKNTLENMPPGNKSAKNGPPEKAPPGNKNQRRSPSKNGPPRNKSLRNGSAKNLPSEKSASRNKAQERNMSATF